MGDKGKLQSVTAISGFCGKVKNVEHLSASSQLTKIIKRMKDGTLNRKKKLPPPGPAKKKIKQEQTPPTPIPPTVYKEDGSSGLTRSQRNRLRVKRNKAAMRDGTYVPKTDEGPSEDKPKT